jgi:hypothetical protein
MCRQMISTIKKVSALVITPVMNVPINTVTLRIQSLTGRNVPAEWMAWLPRKR